LTGYYRPEGRDSDGHWFFGFELHTVCDQQGHLVKLRISPAKVADITQAEALLSQLRALVVADAAYISAKLQKKLWEVGLLLLSPLRKNMRDLASLAQTSLLKGCSIIETVFSVLKDRLGLISSFGSIARQLGELFAATALDQVVEGFPVPLERPETEKWQGEDCRRSKLRMAAYWVLA
jgi:hypothetical protein